MKIDEEYLKPTMFLDFNHSLIQDQILKMFPNLKISNSMNSNKTIQLDLESIRQIAIKLFYFVRDEIKYTIITSFLSRKMMKSSEILKNRRGYCVQKAILLSSLGRAVGIPSRLHFADIINYKASKKIQRFMGTNLFVWHGFTEFYINNNWIKLTPAFDKELCEEQGFPIVEFDGYNNAVFQPYDKDGNKFIEYIKDRGIFSDVPYNKINGDLIETYGEHVLNNFHLLQ